MMQRKPLKILWRFILEIELYFWGGKGKFEENKIYIFQYNNVNRFSFAWNAVH